MASPLPPDPYLALGVPKDATSAAIKLAYRKLVLKFHPDKVQDASQKEAAADQFHKIQTAYEIVGDEDKRQRYEAQVKLAELRRDVMEKQARSGVRSDVRSNTGYARSAHSPTRSAYPSRGAERSTEKVNVEERRPRDADYFERPRSAPRKDYDYDRSRRTAPRDDRARPKLARQDTKENERARQREKVKQTTRETRRDRDYKYAYAEPANIDETDSDSDASYERARRSRREEDVQRKTSPYYNQAKRSREEPVQPAYVADKKMSSAEYMARDYIERSRGVPRQYQEPDRRPSPPRMASNGKVEYIKRSEGRPPVMVRRGSGRPTTRREAEESPRRSSERERGTRSRRASDEYEETSRRPPPLDTTKSAPESIKLPAEPRRAYSLQADFDNKADFQAPPLKRGDSMPIHPTRRDDLRAPRKQSTLRKTEISEGLPTPGSTPVDGAPKYRYGGEYADDHEYATPDGYRTELREPGASRKVTRSPSPIKEEPLRKEDSRRAASARYATAPTPTSPRPGPSPTSRTTSYMYTPSGVSEMPARPSLSRNESSRKEFLYGEAPTLQRPAMPSRKESSRANTLYGEIPTTRSPRQTRGKWSPPAEDVRYAPKRDDVKYSTGYSSRRPSEVRPSYGRTNSYSQAAY